jgi:hypothetical protein
MIAGIFLFGQKGNKNELNFPKTALYSFSYLLYTKEEKEELNERSEKEDKKERRARRRKTRG